MVTRRSNGLTEVRAVAQFTVLFIGYSLNDLELCYTREYLPKCRTLCEVPKVVSIAESNLSKELKALDKPTKWPGANARLLAVGQGQPVKPIDRLGLFSAEGFERFVLEWADDYLARQVEGVSEVQQRGGAGDKGRDIVVWFGKPGAKERYWHLYQCKRYSSALGEGKAVAEIGKVLYFAWLGDFPMPKEYWFVTRKGVTNDLQDTIDQNKLGESLIAGWEKYCANSITTKENIPLEGSFLAFVQSVDFSFVRVKQPLELLSEHHQTKYHGIVFGSPLVDRPKPQVPPSKSCCKRVRPIGCHCHGRAGATDRRARTWSTSYAFRSRGRLPPPRK